MRNIIVEVAVTLSGIVGFIAVGWVLWRWLHKSEDDPGWLVTKWVLTVLLVGMAVWFMVAVNPYLGVPLAAVNGVIVGLLWGRNIGALVARPLTSAFDGGSEEVEARPFYSIAQAHRKQARYDEALAEIARQLERFPGDVQGLLLRAEIQALNCKDWAAAGETIDTIVADVEQSVAVRAKALQALADWQLAHGPGRESARQSLQRIVDLFADTREAHEAAQHLAHLGDDAWRREQHAPRTLPMIKGDQRLGLRESSPPAPVAEPDPEAAAQELIEHLRAHPLDGDARERLARLYADQYQRSDWAVAELEKLIGQPQVPPKSVARWLHLVADVHIRGAGDEAGARAALERVVTLFPGTALAANARARVDHLKLELRIKKQGRSVHLGPAQESSGTGQDASGPD